MVNSPLRLNVENAVTVMLVQATLGKISYNVRRVAISLAKPVWNVLFVLEKESAEDREEVDDFTTEFDALLNALGPQYSRFTVEILVSPNPLPWLDPAAWRVVYRRREAVGQGDAS